VLDGSCSTSYHAVPEGGKGIGLFREIEDDSNVISNVMVDEEEGKREILQRPYELSHWTG
jgi:hypothetical protein